VPVFFGALFILGDIHRHENKEESAGLKYSESNNGASEISEQIKEKWYAPG
jgi:hypothetical protein